MQADTRTTILDLAEEAARARGVDGFSFADLAKGAGIRKASVHHYFPKKGDLLEALIQRYQDRVTAACAQIDRDHAMAGSRLIALIDIYRAALQEGRSLCLCVAYSTSRESLPKPVLGAMSDFRAIVLRWLTTTFAQAELDGSLHSIAAPEAEAAALLATLEGAQLGARAVGHVGPFDTATALFRARLA